MSRDWPAASAPQRGARGRLRLVAEALRPARPDRSLARPAAGAAQTRSPGLSRYDCASPQDEAVTIALLLRRALEEPGATAALVTPDRELARRVAAELRRWDIDIDDSAGLPLNRTPPGAFLRLVLDLAASELAPVPLLAALKHPLAAGGLRAGGVPRAGAAARRRDPRAAAGARPCRAARRARRRGAASCARFVDRLEACLGAAAGAARRDAMPASSSWRAPISPRPSASPRADERERRARGCGATPAGEAAARLLPRPARRRRATSRRLPGRHYPALFEALSAGAVVRPAYGRHPRLAIWGLVEARLQQADLVVLGGLNEGTWPGPVPTDPWMSRQMRAEFGIAAARARDRHRRA